MARRDAVDAAARALAARDLSRSALSKRLEATGLPAEEREEAIERLAAAGFVDDGRLARSRAERLAARGWGDAGIAARLHAEGIGRAEIDASLADLADELDRAVAIASAAPSMSRRRLAARLTSRGFADEAVAAALVCLDASDEPELR